MVKFSIPFNGDLALMAEAAASGMVEEIYFSGSRGDNVSDWYIDEFDRLNHTRESVDSLVRLCRERGIKSNLTTCDKACSECDYCAAVAKRVLTERRAS